MAEPAVAAGTVPRAGQLGEQAARAVAQDRPFFVVVFYCHEGEKVDFLAGLRRELGARGLHTRTYDPAHNADHGTGKLYGLLAQGGAETIHLVADLARKEDGGFDRGFLDYLNLHRDTINRDRLRLVLFVHESEAETFLRSAGDLWDFRQRTIWLERPAEARGERLWEEVLERSARLLRPNAERKEVDRHIEEVRSQAEAVSDRAERAGLLLDLAEWLLRRNTAAAAEAVAREGLLVAPKESVSLHARLEGACGTALRRQEQNPEALSHLEKALSLSRTMGDRAGEATTLNNISQIYDAWGRHDDALEHLQQSLRIQREIGDRTGEAVSLNNISQVYDAWGRYDDALEYLQQSLQIRREIGDRAGEAANLNNISQIYGAWGRYDDALQHIQQSVQICREIGNRSGEATTLNNISQIYDAWGRYDDALQHLQQSLQISREIGDRAQEAITLCNISTIYHVWGRFEDALRYLRQSLQIQREIGDREGEAVTLNNISQIHRAGGRYEESLDHLHSSLRISREIGDRSNEAVTLWNLGLEHTRRGELEEAVEYLRASVVLEEDLAHPDATTDREYLTKIEARLREQSEPEH